MAAAGVAKNTVSPFLVTDVEEQLEHVLLSFLLGHPVLQLQERQREAERLRLHPDPGRPEGHRAPPHKVQHLRQQAGAAAGHHLQ